MIMMFIIFTSVMIVMTQKQTQTVNDQNILENTARNATTAKQNQTYGYFTTEGYSN